MRQPCPGLLLTREFCLSLASALQNERLWCLRQPLATKAPSPAGPLGHICQEPACPPACMPWHAAARLLPFRHVNKPSLAGLPRRCQLLFRRQRGRAAPAGRGAERYLRHHLFHQLIKPREKQEATWSSGSLSAGAATLPGGIVVANRRVARDRCGPKEQAGGAMQRAEKLREIGRCPQDPRGEGLAEQPRGQSEANGRPVVRAPASEHSGHFSLAPAGSPFPCGCGCL